MAVVSKSNATTVTAREMLKGQALLMTRKRFFTVRYADGVAGLAEIDPARVDVCGENVGTLKKGLRMQKF